MTTEQTIYSEISTLPDSLKQEVMDFVGFLKSKYKTAKNSELVAKNESLKNTFKKLQNAQVFSEIENPTTWQKELRNEWE